jgi:hypothetical protein
MVTVTGTYHDAAGNPATGAVALTPDVSAVNAGHIITQAPVLAVLDSDGSFTAQVVASDDPGWEFADGVRMPYIVTEDVSGLRSGWMAYIDGPGPVDVSDLVPLSAAPSFPTVDPADYQLRSEKGQPRGYVPLDDQGRIASPTINSAALTGVNTVPDVPLGTVGDTIANLDYVYGTVVNNLQAHNLNMHRAFIRENAGVANVPDTWTEIGYLNVATHEPGTWFFTVSIVWEFDSTNRSALFRFSQDNGATWGDEFSIEPGDATDVQPFSYMVPRLSQGAASVVRMQARKETGSPGTLTTRYCDLTFFRVA